MSDTTFAPAEPETTETPLAAVVQVACEECVGSGGWFRYEPALEPAPGLLYLSCLQCRGRGRMEAARA